jgi:hypothetical protein
MHAAAHLRQAVKLTMQAAFQGVLPQIPRLTNRRDPHALSLSGSTFALPFAKRDEKTPDESSA